MELNVDEIVKNFNDSELLTSKAQKENEFRKDKKFCDLTLKINNKDLFQVHKNVIASSCTYFNGLLNGDWIEAKEDTISLDYDIIPECFEILLNYMYTGNLGFSKITYENAIILHQGALFFNLPKLKKIVSKILVKFISDDNLLNLWRHGVQHFDDDLRDKCLESISKNSMQFFKKNLIKLSFTELETLCKEKRFKCSEDNIYDNLIIWIKTEFESREKYLKNLLDLIDFTKISGEFMKLKILNDKMLYKNDDFVDKITGQLSECFKVIPKNTIITNNNNYMKILNILLISDTGIFKIDWQTKICSRLLTHKTNRRNFSITKCESNNNILICGGIDNNTCEYYSPDFNLIREFPSMLENRSYHRVSVYNNKIYAFGGVNSHTMEIYSMDSGKWIIGPKMPSVQWNFALEEHNGIFYLMGGVHRCFGAGPISKFDIENNKWDNSSTVDVTGLRSVIIGNTAYIFDYNGFTEYDIITNKVITKKYEDNASIGSYRPFDIVKIDNQILIIGNKHEKFFSYIFDITTQKSEKLDIDISKCGDIGEEYHLTTAFL